MLKRAAACALAWGVLGSGMALADSWDIQTENDNSVSTTENELVHGSDQIHDLGVLSPPGADNDWYRLRQEAYASYEIVLDATSGDIGPGVGLLQRTDSSGAALQQSQAVGPGIDFSLSLRWENATASAVTSERIWVHSVGCTTGCDGADSYRIRAYETTYAVPRYNNSATQTTILVLQNPTSYSVAGRVWFWDTAGAAVANYAFSLGPKALLSLNTPVSVPLTAGTSGSITISHTARYGDLAGKAVAVEPATGFTFDTPMVLKAR